MTGYQLRGGAGKSERVTTGGLERRSHEDEMPRDDADVPRDGHDNRLNSKLQEAIGRSLKAHYDDLVHAPIPDKFLELLARLEMKERSGSTEGDDERR
jgi:hypothetical protein